MAVEDLVSNWNTDRLHHSSENTKFYKGTK